MVKRIQLSRGLVTVVDDEDFDRFSCFKWHAVTLRGGHTYAKRIVKTPTGYSSAYLHRAILDAPHGLEVDHRDHDGLNNRRDNLRLATRSQNNANASRRGSDPTSAFRGVSWARHDQRWRAQITAAGRHIYLGNFVSEVAAARAYDAAALTHFGPFASLNFPR